jgi:hypothetical protein
MASSRFPAPTGLRPTGDLFRRTLNFLFALRKIHARIFSGMNNFGLRRSLVSSFSAQGVPPPSPVAEETSITSKHRVCLIPRVWLHSEGTHSYYATVVNYEWEVHSDLGSAVAISLPPRADFLLCNGSKNVYYLLQQSE